MSEYRHLGRILAGGMLAAVAFQSVGLLLARKFQFSLIYLIPPALVLYATVAALIARYSSWYLGVLAAFATTVVDATVGTGVSWIVGAGVPPANFTGEYVKNLVYGAVYMASLGGFIGAPIGSYVRGRKSRSSEAPAQTALDAGGG